MRGAAEMCGTTHKTVKRILVRHNLLESAATPAPERKQRSRNYDGVEDLVAERVRKTEGRISAKRLLPEAGTAGYGGSARNFRRLVASQKALWRRGNRRGRRPAVWTPGDTLVIDWGVENGLHVFCAVLACGRRRFVRVADNERAEATLGMLAQCFEALGGVPEIVLADRMGCLKGGVVANLVVPTPDYVRFATHYRFRPDFCHAHDPESKGDRGEPGRLRQVRPDDPDRRHGQRRRRRELRSCALVRQVKIAVHSEICAVPADRLVEERALLGELPSLRPGGIGLRPASCKVDMLSCRAVRLGPILGPDPPGRRERPGRHRPG